MNSNRCSELLLAALVLVSVFAAPAAAVSTDDDVPDEAAVGEQTSATVTLTELYREPTLEEWTLAGETELTDVTWTVVYYDQTGAKVDQESFDGQTFDGADVVADEGVSEIRVKVTGTVPEVEEYSYDPAQTMAVMTLYQTRSGGSTAELGAWETHHYTEESDAARDAIDAAGAAIAAADGANTAEAEKQYANAVSAFETGSFELATTLAEESEAEAGSAKQSSRTRQTIVYAVAGLVAVGVLVGGTFWFRSQRSVHDKLG